MASESMSSAAASSDSEDVAFTSNFASDNNKNTGNGDGKSRSKRILKNGGVSRLGHERAQAPMGSRSKAQAQDDPDSARQTRPFSFPEKRSQSTSSSETANLVQQHLGTPATACGAMLVGFKGQAMESAAAMATAAVDSDLPQAPPSAIRNVIPSIDESMSQELSANDAASTTDQTAESRSHSLLSRGENNNNPTSNAIQAHDNPEPSVRLICDRYGFIIGESSEPFPLPDQAALTAAREKTIRNGRKKGLKVKGKYFKETNQNGNNSADGGEGLHRLDSYTDEATIGTTRTVATAPRSQDKRPESLGQRQRRGADLSDQEAQRRMKKEQGRLPKWDIMVKEWNTLENTSSRILQRRIRTRKGRIRKGIPNDFRGQVWPLLANVPSKIKNNPNTYKDLVWSTEIPSQEIRDTIERDIHRTFPRHVLFFQDDEEIMNASGNGRGSKSKTSKGGGKFFTTEQLDEYATRMFACGNDEEVIQEEIMKKKAAARNGLTATDANGMQHAERDLLLSKGGQASLRRVLRAYSLYDSVTGYCQGMNFIAASFITLMSEEEAFWLLVAVMNEKPTLLRGLFGLSMDQTRQILYTSEKLVEDTLPDLHQHFTKEGMQITMFATEWMLTLYTSSFPFDLVLRVWDVFIAEGYKVVYRVMLALLKDSQEKLLGMSFEQMMEYLNGLPATVDGAKVMKIAFSIPLSRKQIIKYDEEWKVRES